MFSADPAAVDKVNGGIRPCVVRIRYARGSHHHHLFCLVDALSRPAVGGAHALGFDSIAALLGRLFLRPVLIIVANSFDRAPGNSRLSSRWVAELRYSYLG